MIAVGSVWLRRVTPAEPDGWDRIIVTGVYAQPDENEVVVKQESVFGPALSVTESALRAAFDLVTEPPKAADSDIGSTGGEWC